MSTTALEALVSSMSLSDLAQRSGRSVEEIVNWAMGGARAAEAKRGASPRPAPASSTKAAAAPAAASTESSAAPPRRASGSGSKNVNTRTPEGRQRYDNAVLTMVQEADGPIAAATIRDGLGGTPLQVRAALNRLIESGQVEYQGRARAMRYTAR